MCKQCHQFESEEQTKEMLTACLINPNFENWNTTSLNHLYMTALGCDGEENRKLSIRLLENFIQYRKQKMGCLTIDKFRLNPCPTPCVSMLKKSLKTISHFPSTNFTVDDIRHKVYNENLLYDVWGN
jgi:hypothetical protein